MKDKINYVEAMKIYINKSSHYVSKRVIEGRYYNKGKRHTIGQVNVIVSPKERVKSIILTYIIFILSITLTVFITLIAYPFLYVGLMISSCILYYLLWGCNFSFIKVLIFKNLYNDESNAYKLLLKELLYNTLEDLLNVKKQYSGLGIDDYSYTKILKIKKYYITKNKNRISLFIERNKITLFNSDLEIIIEKDNYSLDELKKVLLEQINNALISEPKNYKWVYVGNINKKEPFKAYGIKMKFKKLYENKKELCVSEKSLPNIKKGGRYSYYDKKRSRGLHTKHYYLLLAKLDDNTYAMFEKHEC